MHLLFFPRAPHLPSPGCPAALDLRSQGYYDEEGCRGDASLSSVFVNYPSQCLRVLHENVGIIVLHKFKYQRMVLSGGLNHRQQAVPDLSALVEHKPFLFQVKHMNI